MFDQLSGFIWFDGKLLPWKDAQCHVMTHALHYASSVYEGLRCYKGKVFKAQAHYNRFHRSAAYLGFAIPYSVQHLIEATQHLATDYQQGYIRAISWCGSKVMTVSHRQANVHTAIGVWERPMPYAPQVYTQGIRMHIADWRRPDPRTAPVHSKASGMYMISSLSKRTAELEGFDDALMLDYQGHIAEATSSNIFFVIKGKLCTPLPTCFLNGITRLTCIEVARALDIVVEELTLGLEDMEHASEAFLTGTAIEILPIGSIEGAGRRWSFQPGPITTLLRSAFQEMKDNLDHEPQQAPLADGKKGLEYSSEPQQVPIG